MPKAIKTPTTAKPAAALAPPSLPGPSAEEQEHDRTISVQLRNLIEIVTQQNLDRVVLLAQMASRRELPKQLQDHFGELGRRYADLVSPGAPARPAKPRVRLVAENGAAVLS